MVLRCLFRYLTHKVVDDFHFLLFLSIHFLHFADYNPADQTVQHGFVQFLNGSILAAFICSVIRFGKCSIIDLLYSFFRIQLIVSLFVIDSRQLNSSRSIMAYPQPLWDITRYSADNASATIRGYVFSAEKKALIQSSS